MAKVSLEEVYGTPPAAVVDTGVPNWNESSPPADPFQVSPEVQGRREAQRLALLQEERRSAMDSGDEGEVQRLDRELSSTAKQMKWAEPTQTPAPGSVTRGQWLTDLAKPKPRRKVSIAEALASPTDLPKVQGPSPAMQALEKIEPTYKAPEEVGPPEALKRTILDSKSLGEAGSHIYRLWTQESMLADLNRAWQNGAFSGKPVGEMLGKAANFPMAVAKEGLGDFSITELWNAAKENPKQVMGGLIDAVIADPILLAVPFLAEGRVAYGTALTAGRFGKTAESAGRMVGRAAEMGVSAGALNAPISMAEQLAKTGAVDPRQVATDIAVGGAFGAAIGVAVHLGGSLLNVKPSEIYAKWKERMSRGDAEPGAAMDETLREAGLDAGKSSDIAGAVDRAWQIEYAEKQVAEERARSPIREPGTPKEQKEQARLAKQRLASETAFQEARAEADLEASRVQQEITQANQLASSNPISRFPPESPQALMDPAIPIKTSSSVGVLLGSLDAAMAKPGFARTAEDILTIRRAASLAAARFQGLARVWSKDPRMQAALVLGLSAPWWDSLSQEQQAGLGMAAMALSTKGEGIKASVKADTGRLIDLLGSSMYMGRLTDVAVKELLQNAFDAVKSVKGGPKNVEINMDPNGRTISVSDTGIGMTPKILQDAFFTIGGTEKSALAVGDRSGGLGLAKMAFLFGSDRVRVETVHKGKLSVVDADSQTMRTGEFDIQVSPAEGRPSGTKVTVHIPKSYMDPRSGEPREIYFPWGADAVSILTKPLIGDVEVGFTRGARERQVLPIGRHFDLKETPKFTTAKFDWGSADVYVSKKRSETPKHSVLSAGLYQFDAEFKKPGVWERIPYNIIVDVHPNVEPTHPSYPFNNQREGWRGTVQADIKALEKYLQTMHSATEAQATANQFRNAVSMPKVPISLEGGEFDPEFLKRARRAFAPRQGPRTTQPVFRPEDFLDIREGGVFGAGGRELVPKESERLAQESFKADRELPTRESFMLEGGFDPNSPILHSNLNVDVVAEAKARDPSAQPEAFFSELGSLVWEFKKEASELASPYWARDMQGDYAVGISLDKGYKGVHVRVPYKAFFVNPLALDAGSVGQYGREFLTSMLHEAAHTRNMLHNEDFMLAYHNLESSLALNGRHRFYEDAAMAIGLKYERTLNIMKDIFDESTTRNLAKSIDPHEAQAQRSGRVAGPDDQTLSELPRRSDTGDTGAGPGDAAAQASGPADAAAGTSRGPEGTVGERPTIQSPDLVDRLAEVEGADWAAQQKAGRFGDYGIPAMLQGIQKYASKYGLADAIDILPNRVIYGRDGYNRYIVQPDGSIHPDPSSFPNKEKLARAQQILSGGDRGPDELKGVLTGKLGKLAAAGAAFGVGYAGSQNMTERDWTLAGAGGLAMAVKGKGGMWHPEAPRILADAMGYTPAGRPLTDSGGSFREWALDRTAKYLNRYAGTTEDPLKDVRIPVGQEMKRWEDVTDKAILHGKASGYQNPHVTVKHPEVVMRAPPGEDIWNIGVPLDERNARVSSYNAITSYLAHVGDYLRTNVQPDQLQRYDFVRAVRETIANDARVAREAVQGFDRESQARVPAQAELPTYKSYGEVDLPKRTLELNKVGSKQQMQSVQLPAERVTLEWKELALPQELTPEQARTVRPISEHEFRVKYPNISEGLTTAKFQEHLKREPESIALDARGRPIRDNFSEDVASGRTPREAWLAGQLALEGNVMGHCVGGYCSDVISGAQRILSLRDSKGRSYATVELRPEPPGVSSRDLPRDRPATAADIAALEAKRAKERIAQIKGPGNGPPPDYVLPYVQDLVKSGKWADVRDLENAQLLPHMKHGSTLPHVYERPEPSPESIGLPPGYYTREELHAAYTKAGAKLDTRFQQGPGGTNLMRPRERGGVDPGLLMRLAAVGLGGYAGASVYQDNPLVGAGAGALAVLAAGRSASLLKALKGLGKDALMGADYGLGMVSTRLKNIHPSLRWQFIKFEWGNLVHAHEALQRVDPFLVKLESLPSDVRRWLDLELQSEDPLRIKAALVKVGSPELVKGWTQLQSTLKNLGEQLKEGGWLKELGNIYMPRVVIDREGLLKELGSIINEERRAGGKPSVNIELKHRLEEQLHEADRRAINTRGYGLSQVEESVIIGRYLKEFIPGYGQPGFAKGRVIDEITQRLQPFYATIPESIHTYVKSAVGELEKAKLFGSALRMKKAGKQSYINEDASIEAMVQGLLKDGKIQYEQVDDLKSLMKSRLRMRPTGKIVQNIKNIGYWSLLTDLGPSITQFGDTMMAMFHQGLRPSLEGLARTLSGRKLVRMEEFGLADLISEEFANTLTTSKWLSRAMKPIFYQIDKIGKDVNLNAALVKLRRWAVSSPEKLERTYKESLGSEFPQLVADLKGKRDTPLVRQTLFAELSDAQPISKLELPQAYQDHPNGRLMYQLHTWQLKQLDIARRRVYNEFKSGNVPTALRNMTALLTVAGLANASSEQLKNLIWGRPFDLSWAPVLDNMMKTFGWSQYMTEQVARGETSKAAAGMLLPPHFRILDDVIKGDNRWMKYAIPWFGRTLYEREFGGREAFQAAQRRREEKQRREERIPIREWERRQR